MGAIPMYLENFIQDIPLENTFHMVTTFGRM